MYPCAVHFYVETLLLLHFLKLSTIFAKLAAYLFIHFNKLSSLPSACPSVLQDLNNTRLLDLLPFAYIYHQSESAIIITSRVAPPHTN